MSRHRSAHPAIQLFPFLAVLVSVMGALIFLLLVTSKRIPQVAIARARAAQTRLVPPVASIGPVLSIPEIASEPSDDVFPELPAVDLGGEGPTPAELLEEERNAARETERRSLIDQWRRRIKTLQEERDRSQSGVQQQQLLTTAAERQQLKMLAELQELERKLGSLTGKITAGSMHAGHADRERIQLEQRILGLRRQLKMTSDQQRADAGKYSIVPFDGKSGTTRRPILIECTSTGFRFVPEDVSISAADIEGFTERQNPLLAGAVALTQYWNQVNQEQGSATPDTQPYVLLIVRPSGTLGYYVSVRLLSALRQQHGYELVAEDVALQWPAVNAGAQAACRAAVEGMLSQRTAVARNADGPTVGGSNAYGNTTSGGGGGGGTVSGAVISGIPSNNRGGFQLSDLDAPSDEVGDRSWEDPSRFGGLEHRRNRSTGSDSAGSSPGTGGGFGSPGTGTPGTSTDDPIAGSSNRTVPERNTSAPPSNWTARPTSAQRTAPEPNNVDAGKPQSPASTARERPPAPPVSQESSTETRPVGTRPASPGTYGSPRNGRTAQNGEQRLARGPRRGNGEDIPYERLQHRRWGQFEDGANIGLEKPVAIFVDAEQIVVAEQLIIPIRPGATRNEIFDQLLSAIDEDSATWGRAAAGFFWVPSLRFVISPGGNQIYDRLAPLVTRSGLRADAEFTLDEPKPLPQGGRR